MIETKFEDAVLFIPVCANCGVAVVNRDQIEAGQKLEMHRRRESHLDPSKYIPWKTDYYTFSPACCPRCHTQFTSAVMPFAVENDSE